MANETEVVEIDEKEVKRENKARADASTAFEKSISGKRTKFSELVVGRHYHFIGKAANYVGELKATDKGGLCSIDYLIRGRVRSTVDLNFKYFDAIEISREQAHDLSRV